MKKFNVAIDGPAGAGKSSISKAVAKKLEFIYVDTGAMYRAIALKLHNENVDIQTCQVDEILNSTTVDIKYINDELRIFLDEKDVSDLIRSPKISVMASDVSKISSVRAKLLDLQRNIAKNNNCIMDGRDIGTVVLPNADLKIFLTASPFKRATRRYDELVEKGETVDFDEVLNDIIYRDKNDSERKIAPLKKASDAILVDTSEIDFNNSVKKIEDLISSFIKGDK